MTDLDGAAQELSWTTPHTAPADAWPHPTTERWQPLRLGLVDMFYYDDEQFWFHDGRLLLRGNNGTGKSKVLALTLPFLLDGSVQPRRVEPDADPKKKMEWNLLLGGAHAAPERTGYAWVEFGRLDADGTEHFTTLGIGLKAATGRGIVKTWYFTSTRRIGDLRLVDADRVVLTQERLRDEFAATASGQLHPTQEAYRRAVDEALFRLGEERYRALIDLLIQLRQPQLSKRPDEKALSAALTEALTPLDQAVVADVAESFRSLEEERAGIAEARDTLGAAEEFLKHYRAYAAVAARRHTTAVREANSAYEWAGRNLRDAQSDLVEVAGEVDRLEAAAEDAQRQLGGLEGQEQALRESPEMRDARRLDEAATAATDAETRADRAEQEAQRARERAEQDATGESAAVASATEASGEAQRLAAAAASLAGPVGLGEENLVLLGDEQAAQRALTRRRDQIDHVHGLVDAARTAAARSAARRTALDDAAGEETRRGEEVRAAEALAEEAVGAYVTALREFAAGLTVFEVDGDPDDLATRAEEWARTLGGESPARAVVEAAAGAALEAISRDQALAEQTIEALGKTLAEVREQIATLEAGRDREPTPAPARDPRARDDADGAPLWRLTEFADTVGAAEQGALEAALESAGLLDAWVFPDGTLSVAGDVVLGPAGAEVEVSLAGALVPAIGPDDGVPAEAVAAVLARIGLGAQSGAALWVDTNGQWGSGPVRGVWAKERAEFIGAGARAAHRRALIVELGAEVASLQGSQDEARQRLAAADELAARVRAERGAYPADSEVALRSVQERAAAAQRELGVAEERVQEARTRWEQADRAAAQAAHDLEEQASQLSLGTTVADLQRVTRALSDYQVGLVAARAATRRLTEVEATREAAAHRAAESGEVRQETETQWRDNRREAESRRAKYAELQATVGASVAELQARLAKVQQEMIRLRGELEHLAVQRREAERAVGGLQQKVENIELQRTQTAQTREREVGRLRAFVSTGLLRVALPELATPDAKVAEEWTVTAAVGLSRTAEQELDAVDESDDAWSRAQQRVSTASTELSSQMSRHGHTSFIEQHGDVLVARVRYLAQEVDIDHLALKLAQDVADRERLLSAREREILENHLVNEVAGHLHELLSAAEAQIDRMNRELAERKTSTGMQLRVRWRERSDGPAGLAAARSLMLRSDATWTPEDRSAIGAFLQDRIAEVRQEDPAGGWQEHLEQALDYRHWHSFLVERWQDGTWRSASGPASGGEKVLAVSVPLFAAASAHYNSAGKLAPRLILLDEAFAGIDDDSRAKSLGLLATFDLDVVMTSEREWGCYPQVPGLSIAQLSRVEGIDAVGVTRWRWDGRRRRRVDEVSGLVRASGVPSVEPEGESLFAGSLLDQE